MAENSNSTDAANGGMNKKTEEKEITTQQDAIALLKADHRKVETLFSDYEKATSSSEKRKIVDEVTRELIVHARIEEEIFYPACREHTDDDEGLDEALVEHDGAKILIAELIQGKPDDDCYDAKMKVLSEQIKHHVKEEEKRSDSIFAEARAAGMDLKKLGDRMTKLKDKLSAQIEREGIDLPQYSTFASITQAGKDHTMSRYRNRDEEGRFTSDDDRDYRRSRGYDDDNYDRSRDRYYNRSRRGDNYNSQGNYRENYNPPRDEEGRFASSDNQSRREDHYGRDDEDRDRYSRYSGGNRGNYDQPRENGGGFTRDDRDYYRNRSGRGNYDQPRDEVGRFANESGGRRTRSYDDDDYRNDHGQDGWFGDSDRHARAARKGWSHRDH